MPVSCHVSIYRTIYPLDKLDLDERKSSVFVSNISQDQAVHLLCLISAFVIRFF